MSEVRVPRSRLSLFAVVMLFLVGLFTIIFVNTLVGILILALSVLLYLVLVWLTARFAKGLKQVDENSSDGGPDRSAPNGFGSGLGFKA